MAGEAQATGALSGIATAAPIVGSVLDIATTGLGMWLQYKENRRAEEFQMRLFERQERKDARIEREDRKESARAWRWKEEDKKFNKGMMLLNNFKALANENLEFRDSMVNSAIRNEQIRQVPKIFRGL